MVKKLDLTKQVYSYLTVLKEHPDKNNRFTRPQIQWICKCICGNEVVVTTRELREGHKKSCGCMHRKSNNMSNTRIYSIWHGMKDRCDRTKNTRFKYYGGNKISYCDRWKDFNNFYEDMKDNYKDNLTLDRIDYSKGYFKKNCRWVSQKEQVRNRSITLNITYNGVTKPLAEFAEEFGLPYEVLYDRCRRNWSIERALNQPMRKGIQYTT